MPSLTTKYPTTTEWSALARVTAAADLPVLVTNPDQKVWLVLAVTNDLTAPSALVPRDGDGIAVQQGQNFSMTLAAGETLWMARRSGSGFAQVTV